MRSRDKIVLLSVPLPSSRHQLSNDDCLEDKSEKYQFCAVLCTIVVHNDIYEQFLKLSVGFNFKFSILCFFSGLAHTICSSAVRFCCVTFSFFSILTPRDWMGKRLRNDGFRQFCVEWDVKP